MKKVGCRSYSSDSIFQLSVLKFEGASSNGTTVLTLLPLQKVGFVTAVLTGLILGACPWMLKRRDQRRPKGFGCTAFRFDSSGIMETGKILEERAADRGPFTLLQSPSEGLPGVANPA